MRKYRVFIGLLLAFVVLGFGTTAKAQTVALSQFSFEQFFAQNNAPLSGGQLYVFNSGTSTFASTFTDSTGLILNLNPVPLNSSGYVPGVWLLNQLYKFVLCSQFDGAVCAAGDIQWTVDNVPGFGGLPSGGNIFTGTFISGSANPATTGILRLASSDRTCWLNTAGNANLCFSKNANDQLLWGGTFGFFLPEAGLAGTAPANFGGFAMDSGAHKPAGFFQSEAAWDDLVGDNSADTLTNKTLTSPVINGTPTGTGLQGTDTKILSSGTIAGIGPICVDANGGASTAGCLPSFVNISPVTTVSSVSTADQNLMSIALPAGALNNVNHTINIFATVFISNATGGVDGIDFKLKLCTVLGCGAGVVLVVAPTSARYSVVNAVTNAEVSIVASISTQTAGAAAAFEAHIMTTCSGSGLIAPCNLEVSGDANVATVTPIDSTQPLFLQLTNSWNAGFVGATTTQRQMILQTILN